MDEQSVIEQAIATIIRKGYKDKKDEQFRIEVSSFNGKKYISLRLWWQTPEGEWAPSKKGISVRVGEVEQVIEALHKCEDYLFKADQGTLPLPSPEKKRAYQHPPAGKQKAAAPNPIKSDGTIADENVF